EQPRPAERARPGPLPHDEEQRGTVYDDERHRDERRQRGKARVECRENPDQPQNEQREKSIAGIARDLKIQRGLAGDLLGEQLGDSELFGKVDQDGDRDAPERNERCRNQHETEGEKRGPAHWGSFLSALEIQPRRAEILRYTADAED